MTTQTKQGLDFLSPERCYLIPRHMREDRTSGWSHHLVLPPQAQSQGGEVTLGDGWMEGRIDGQRQWDQEEATASKVLTLSSLASGGRRGMTDHQGQGAAWADPDSLWGGPINTVDSQHPGTWCFKAAEATDTSWSSWPWFPKASGGRKRQERKAAPALGASQTVEESS